MHKTEIKYQLADMINGVFGDVFDSLEAAEAALAEAIEEGQKANDEMAAEVGIEAEDASEFFKIVEVEAHMKNEKQNFENVKNTYVVYQSFHQHASGGIDEVWPLFETKENALGFIVNRFAETLTSEQEADLKECGAVDLGDYVVGLVLVSDITEDDNYCEWTTNEKLAGEVIVTVTNANSSNTQRRHLVRSEFLMDC